MKRRIPVLIVLAALIAAGVYLYPQFTKKAEPANELALSGNIEAHESLVSFKVQGRIVDLPVEEGQWVERGALLARLDDADYRVGIGLHLRQGPDAGRPYRGSRVVAHRLGQRLGLEIIAIEGPAFVVNHALLDNG